MNCPPPLHWGVAPCAGKQSGTFLALPPPQSTILAHAVPVIHTPSGPRSMLLGYLPTPPALPARPPFPPFPIRGPHGLPQLSHRSSHYSRTYRLHKLRIFASPTSRSFKLPLPILSTTGPWEDIRPFEALAEYLNLFLYSPCTRRRLDLSDLRGETHNSQVSCLHCRIKAYS